MKRLFFVASLAILAAACQKTEIQNEVQTPISFSTETGKQTRAIVDGTDAKYPTDQPFGVYAYSYQLTTDANGAYTTTRKEGSDHQPMNNVEVSNSNSKWAATGDVKYYWPNDPSTRLDFYAYSPVTGSQNTPSGKTYAPHQTLNGLSHSEADGLKLTDYIHSNMYVDFMVATPVIGATYSCQNGDANDPATGDVPLVFGHKMTQVNFTVKLNAPVKEAVLTDEETTTATTYENTYPNIDFTINSIVLNNIVSQSTYSYKYEFDTGTGADATLAWTPAQTPVISAYKVYPATTDVAPTDGEFLNSYGAPALTNIDASSTDKTEAIVVLRTDANGGKREVGGTETTLTVNAANPGVSFNTTPVTMIPQTWSTDAPQSVTITYTISGVGVAKETVVKTFSITNTSYPKWDINKKITYTLTIGLNEITFEPSVTNWENNEDVYEYSPENIKPTPTDPTVE